MRHRFHHGAVRDGAVSPAPLVSTIGLAMCCFFIEGIFPGMCSGTDQTGWGDWGWIWLGLDSIPYGPFASREWLAGVAWLTTGYLVVLGAGRLLALRALRHPTVGEKPVVLGIALLGVAGVTGWVTAKHIQPRVSSAEACRLADQDFADGWPYGLWLFCGFGIPGAEARCRVDLSDDDPTARFAAAVVLRSHGENSSTAHAVLVRAGDQIVEMTSPAKPLDRAAKRRIWICIRHCIRDSFRWSDLADDTDGFHSAFRRWWTRNRERLR